MFILGVLVTGTRHRRWKGYDDNDNICVNAEGMIDIPCTQTVFGG